RRGALAAVGHARRVSQVDGALPWQPGLQCLEHREPAEAGVEDTYEPLRVALHDSAPQPWFGPGLLPRPPPDLPPTGPDALRRTRWGFSGAGFGVYGRPWHVRPVPSWWTPPWSRPPWTAISWSAPMTSWWRPASSKSA